MGFERTRRDQYVLVLERECLPAGGRVWGRRVRFAEMSRGVCCRDLRQSAQPEAQPAEGVIRRQGRPDPSAHTLPGVGSVTPPGLIPAPPRLNSVTLGGFLDLSAPPFANILYIVSVKIRSVCKAF